MTPDIPQKVYSSVYISEWWEYIQKPVILEYAGTRLGINIPDEIQKNLTGSVPTIFIYGRIKNG